MKLLQLKYFLTICEYSNISRAAGKLHVSQPSLTAAMKSLEQEFGITLFHRQSRGLILTEEGEIFRKEAAALMEHADLFSEKMMAMGTKKQDIRLGVSPMLSILLFPALVQSFHQAYPDARIQTYLIWNTSQPQNAGIRHQIQTARYFASSQLFPS